MKLEVSALIFFRKKKSLDEVIKETGRAKTTVLEYLADYLERESPARLMPIYQNQFLKNTKCYRTSRDGEAKASFTCI